MASFADYTTMYGGGYYGYLLPSFGNGANITLLAYTQLPCVVRMATSSNTTTATVIAVIYTQYGLSGQDSVSVEINFGNSNTQYLDITDVLRSGILRNDITGNITESGTPCRLEFEEFDSNGTSLGVKSQNLIAYDSVGVPDTQFVAPLPDTLRMVTGTSLNQMFFGGMARLCKGFRTLTLYDSSGTPIDVATYQAYFTYNLQFPLYPNMSKVELSGDDTFAARVLYTPKCGDVAQIRWWSPVDGGWKTCAIKLRGGGWSVDGKADYVTMFEPYGGRNGKQTIRCAIENCTPNDAQYYSDIYLSDQVELYWNDYFGPVKRLRVEGTPPAYGNTGYVDLEFDATLEEVSSLC